MQLEFPLGKDNSQKIKLTDTSTGQWAVTDLSVTSRAVVTFGEFIVDSDDDPTAFVLTDNDGTITLKFGMVAGLKKGIFNNARITIYEPANPNGIQWSPPFVVKII